MEEKLTSRQKQAKKTKHKIYRTAIQLFAESGFDKVTIQDICTAANISVGGFYHYFKTKTDILDEGYISFDEDVQKAFSNNDFSLTPLESIYFLLHLQAEAVIDLGDLAFSEFLKNMLTKDGKYILNTDRFFYRAMYASVLQAIDSHILDGDASTINQEILCITRGTIYDWCLHKGGFNLKERSLKLIGILLESYKTR